MTHPSENIFATTQTPHSAIQRCLIISSVSTDHPALCHKPLYAESLLASVWVKNVQVPPRKPLSLRPLESVSEEKSIMCDRGRILFSLAKNFTC